MNKASLKLIITVAVFAVPVLLGRAHAYELTIPLLEYRTGPYAQKGVPLANGYADYLQMLNQRDGGINGARIKLVSCETGYNNRRGLECYQSTRYKGESGALVYQPFSKGITYQLIEKADSHNIPIFSMGYGRTLAANGTLFPWVFNFPATYWSQATAFLQYIAEQEGGMNNLKGKSITLIHHNSAYGQEPIATLQRAALKLGFKLSLLPVEHPGQDQKRALLQISTERPDWILMWGWGIMNQVAINEAAAIGFPMDHFIGSWWSGSENDVLPAGEAAHGYLSGAFHQPGGNFPAHDDIRRYVYDKGMGLGERERIGEVLYNRGLVAAMWTAEAIRKAMQIHGTNRVKSVHVRDGFEALEVDEKRLQELGLPGFTVPVSISCENHEGPGRVALQQWDAGDRQWNLVSEFYQPLRDITDPLAAEDSLRYAIENDVVPRICD